MSAAERSPRMEPAIEMEERVRKQSENGECDGAPVCARTQRD
jgi:hypothetical protein